MKLAAENPGKYEGKEYRITKAIVLDYEQKVLDSVWVHGGVLFKEKGNIGCYAYINSNAEVELIQEPVDFMTAVNSGKRIKPVNNADNWCYNFAKVWVSYFSYGSRSAINTENYLDYINGQWLIEEE